MSNYDWEPYCETPDYEDLHPEIAVMDEIIREKMIEEYETKQLML